MGRVAVPMAIDALIEIPNLDDDCRARSHISAFRFVVLVRYRGSTDLSTSSYLF
jgi:hypothetical protein